MIISSKADEFQVGCVINLSATKPYGETYIYRMWCKGSTPLLGSGGAVQIGHLGNYHLVQKAINNLISF